MSENVPEEKTENTVVAVQQASGSAIGIKPARRWSKRAKFTAVALVVGFLLGSQIYFLHLTWSRVSRIMSNPRMAVNWSAVASSWLNHTQGFPRRLISIGFWTNWKQWMIPSMVWRGQQIVIIYIPELILCLIFAVIFGCATYYILGKEKFKMSENTPEEKTGNTVVVVQQAPSSAVGICALVFAVLGIFLFAIVFVPLSLILSIIAIVKKQYGWGICALILNLIAVFTSPTILLLLGIAAMR